MAYFRHIDDEFDFGKFKGLSLSDVMDIYPQYIIWCMFNVTHSPFIISDEAMKELSIIYPNFTFGSAFEERRLTLLQEWESDLDKENCYGNNMDMDEDEATYEIFNGSYAQDCMEYSDDEIETIFDGDPLAYWNID